MSRARVVVSPVGMLYSCGPDLVLALSCGRETVRGDIKQLNEEVAMLSSRIDTTIRERDEAVAAKATLKATLETVESERYGGGLSRERVPQWLTPDGVSSCAVLCV